jgi:hypothetical protein
MPTMQEMMARYEAAKYGGGGSINSIMTAPGAEEQKVAAARAAGAHAYNPNDPFQARGGEQRMYENRLAAATFAEQQQATRLANAQRAETDRLFGAQLAQSQRDAGGVAAMGGGDPSRLRAASMTQADMSQQGVVDLAQLRAMEDQALLQQRLGVAQRQGDYALGAMGMGAQAYGNAAQQNASEYAHKKALDEIDRQAAMSGVGMGLAAGSAGLAAAGG